MPPLDLAELLPHAEPMVLLDEIVKWNAQEIVCMARSHLNRDNPLRDSGRLSVFCGVEYAAQAMAAHSRLTATATGAPPQGFIATASKLEAAVATLDHYSDALVVTAIQVAVNGDSSLYGFSVATESELLLTGQLMVIKQP